MMKPRNVPGAVLVAGLLCVALAGCGTEKAPGAAGEGRPSSSPSLAAAKQPCPPDETTDETTDDGAGSAEPPTDETTDKGSGSAEPPTGETTDDDAGDAGPPTEGTAPPCLPAGWFDMTQEFTDYYAKHLTKADDGMWPFLVAARLRQEGDSVKALVTVNFIPSGADDYEGRRIAEVFAAWRHETYGDKGRLRIETRSGGRVVEQTW